MHWQLTSLGCLLSCKAAGLLAARASFSSGTLFTCFQRKLWTLPTLSFCFGTWISHMLGKLMTKQFPALFLQHLTELPMMTFNSFCNLCEPWVCTPPLLQVSGIIGQHHHVQLWHCFVQVSISLFQLFCYCYIFLVMWSSSYQAFCGPGFSVIEQYFLFLLFNVCQGTKFRICISPLRPLCSAFTIFSLAHLISFLGRTPQLVF